MPLFEKPGERSPSLIGVFFFAVLIASIGAFSGFALLASVEPKPFESVAEYTTDLESRTTTNLLDPHYFRSSKSENSDWAAKRETLLTASNTTVELTDAEINAWIADKFIKPKKPSPEEKRPQIVVVPSLPSFFIDAAEGLSFSLLLEVFIFKKQYNYILICEGNFSEEAPILFEVTSLRLNEAMLPVPVESKNRLLDAVLKPFYGSDEFIAFRKAWEKVESVELIDDRICLNLVHETEAP